MMVSSITLTSKVYKFCMPRQEFLHAVMFSALLANV